MEREIKLMGVFACDIDCTLVDRIVELKCEKISALELMGRIEELIHYRDSLKNKLQEIK